MSLWSSFLKKKLRREFLLYADFECYLIKSDEPGILQKHEPNSAAVYFVKLFNPSKNQTWPHVGKYCVSNIIIALNELSQECIKEMQKKTDMVITPRKQNKFDRTTWILLYLFQTITPYNYKVRDHCPRTGKYRGVAHNKCNLNFFSNRYLPVFFHSLKGYDGHRIIKDAFQINQEIGDWDQRNLF